MPCPSMHQLYFALSRFCPWSGWLIAVSVLGYANVGIVNVIVGFEFGFGFGSVWFIYIATMMEMLLAIIPIVNTHVLGLLC